MWDFLEKYIKSDKEYEIRFALVMYLEYFMTEEFIEAIFERIENITNKEYYVQMAIAWLISIAYIKQKERTIIYIQKNSLDKFTQNKAIQKIRESYRVSKEEKESLVQYKK